MVFYLFDATIEQSDEAEETNKYYKTIGDEVVCKNNYCDNWRINGIPVSAVVTSNNWARIFL